MGIQGLLPMLKSIQKPTHLRNFAGQTLGVDAYGWLHRGTVSCAIDIAQSKPTTRYVDFAMNRVRMLIQFGVKPYIVFDGDYLPSKAHTEHGRAARRKESRTNGLNLLAAGKTSQAQLELQKAVDVTPSMARELIEELKAAGVEYVVAPYEADAQLAFLERSGIIHGILSEDSDLLVFGAKCLLTKLDQYGDCVMINRQHFTACREVSLVGWTDADFRMMAMLSGCDYLAGIEKMGLRTAYRMVRKHKTIERIIKMAQFDGKMKIPPGYLESYVKAERTFLYQWVFCPRLQCLVNLNDVPHELSAKDMPYVGSYVEPSIAAGVAVGDLDPNSKKPLIIAPKRTTRSSRQLENRTPHEKAGKSISEFFRLRRTPLAELDPNSFTPSPDQRQVLEQYQRASWSASNAPSPIPHASRPEIRVPRTDPRPPKRSFTTPLPNGKQSPKKKRLCTDEPFTLSMNGLESSTTAKSRFFPASPLSGTQAAATSRRSSSKRLSDFEVFADDLPQPEVANESGPSQTDPKTSVDSDTDRQPGDNAHISAIGSPSNMSKKSQSTARVGRGICSSSVGSHGTQKRINSKKRYSANVQQSPTEERAAASIRSWDVKDIMLGFTYEPSTSQLDVSQTQARSPVIYQPTLSQCQSFASVPSLEDCDTATSQATETQNIEVPNSSPTLSTRRSIDFKLKPEKRDHKHRHMSHRPVDQFSVVAKGSEDLLVPGSPGEPSSPSLSERSNLDLGRFAFAGRIE